jgi:peptide-methionine (S)-S-oxide reductase
MNSKDKQVADFGGGCFWGVEESFRTTKGVINTTVGYEGGHVDNPTYEQVCSHTTGHTETVQVEFDPKVISYGQLLDVFFKLHDPTQMNRQGPDIGENYRSVIFYHNEDQKKEAEEKIKKLDKSKKFTKPIATAVEPASTFWKAEEYHQEYLHKRNLGICY